MYDNYKVKPLHIELSKSIVYVKSHDSQTKWMYFLIEDGNLLEKYNIIWHKVTANIKKEFDSEPVYNKNCLKIKIKSYGDEGTDFYDKEIPKMDSNHTFFPVISLDSALKKNENYYRQRLFKECKYNEKENQVIRHTNDNLQTSSESDELGEK